MVSTEIIELNTRGDWRDIIVNAKHKWNMLNDDDFYYTHGMQDDWYHRLAKRAGCSYDDVVTYFNPYYVELNTRGDWSDIIVNAKRKWNMLGDDDFYYTEGMQDDWYHGLAKRAGCSYDDVVTYFNPYYGELNARGNWNDIVAKAKHKWNMLNDEDFYYAHGMQDDWYHRLAKRAGCSYDDVVDHFHLYY
jgi:hypothetical protein